MATEAGADEFVAWQADRCVARWDADRAEKGLRRWRAVIRSAARQSRRPYLPEVTGPVTTRSLADRIADRVGAGAAVLVLHESATTSLADIPMAEVDSIVMVVGPEGRDHRRRTRPADRRRGGGGPNGPTVLRTSTAAAVALRRTGCSHASMVVRLTGRNYCSKPPSSSL